VADGEEMAELEKHLKDIAEDNVKIEDIRSMEDSIKEERKSRGMALKARLAARRKAALDKKDKKAAEAAAKEIAAVEKEAQELSVEEDKIAKENCSKETQKVLELQKQKDILENTLENTEAEIGEMNSDFAEESQRHFEIADKLNDKLVEERNKQSSKLKERLARKRQRMLERGELKAEEAAAQQEKDDELAEELIRTVEDKSEVADEMFGISEQFDGEKSQLIKSLEHEQKSQREKLKARLASRKAKHKKGGKNKKASHGGADVQKLSTIYSKAVEEMKGGDPKKILQQLLIDLSQIQGVKNLSKSKDEEQDELKRKLKEKIAKNPELAEKYRKMAAKKKNK